LNATASTVVAVPSTVPAPDDAIRVAIKSAIDAGQLERAARLLEVLRSA
jgi:hypothetical protein